MLRAGGRRTRGSRRASRSAAWARSSRSPGSPTSRANGCAITGSSSTWVKPRSRDVGARARRPARGRSASGCPRAVQPPRAEVDLVDRHRLASSGWRSARARSHSRVLVAPLVVAARTRPRRSAAGPRSPGAYGSAFSSSSPSGVEDLVLVARARLDARAGTAPRCPLEPSERIGCRRPSQELKSPTTLTARRPAPTPRTRCRRRRRCSRDVRAEPVVELLVAALADQVQVELAERRRERVRVVDRERAGVAVVDLEPVAQRQLGVLERRPRTRRRGGSARARRARLAVGDAR